MTHTGATRTVKVREAVYVYHPRAPIITESARVYRAPRNRWSAPPTRKLEECTIIEEESTTLVRKGQTRALEALRSSYAAEEAYVLVPTMCDPVGVQLLAWHADVNRFLFGDTTTQVFLQFLSFPCPRPFYFDRCQLSQLATESERNYATWCKIQVKTRSQNRRLKAGQTVDMPYQPLEKAYLLTTMLVSSAKVWSPSPSAIAVARRAYRGAIKASTKFPSAGSSSSRPKYLQVAQCFQPNNRPSTQCL
jgi:hypothetical protein